METHPQPCNTLPEGQHKLCPLTSRAFSDMNQHVVERFNREADVWHQVHSNHARDIIQWEIKKRKLLARDFIHQQFRNKPAAILEVGCGAGRNLEEILNGNQNWTGKGVDVAPAVLTGAKVNTSVQRSAALKC